MAGETARMTSVLRNRRHRLLLPAIAGVAVATCAGLSAPCSADEAAAGQARGGEATAAETPKNPFPGRYPAPSLEGGTEWLNTSEDISLDDLRGKVVLLDFWTYCCINCIHVLPDLKYLEQKYRNELVVIGVHAAKFENEKDSENIRQAILRYEIEHPVVNDSTMTIARKYRFRSWPTLVVIDPQGQYVGFVSGEGNREVLDKVVGGLAAYHRRIGTLNEQPMQFDLERDRVEPSPLKFPGKVLADEAQGRLFISDSNHNRIVVASLEGDLLEVIGTGAIGQEDGPGDSATFDHPQGMILDGDTLYVADTESHLIRTVDLQTKTVSTLAGTGRQARGRESAGSLRETPLSSPWALSIHDGMLYIAMAGPHQLWAHRLGSNRIAPFVGNGREHITDGPRRAAELAQPSGMTHDGRFLYWVDSEGSAVRRMTLGRGARQPVTTIAGPHDIPSALFEFGDVDGIGAEARLQHPLGIVHHEGVLYIADSYNHKIKRLDPDSGRVTTWLGAGEAGSSLDPLQLSEPSGVAVARGKVYIADTNNHRILRVDIASGAAEEFTIKGLTPPESGSN